METRLTLEYWQDDGWYVGRIKEVPGVFSQAETIEELEKNIIDAYSMVINENTSIIPPTALHSKDLVVQI